jgi:hypothetical protein
MKPPPIVRKTTAVFHQSGALQVGKGKITGIIALTLGGLPCWRCSPSTSRSI